jgi:hypothetical protein
MSHVYSPKNFLIQSAPGTEIPGMQNPSKWPAVHSTETQGNAFWTGANQMTWTVMAAEANKLQLFLTQPYFLP